MTKESFIAAISQGERVYGPAGWGPDSKAMPDRTRSGSLQGFTIRPCNDLRYIFWCGQEQVDLRDIRMSFGLPSEGADDHAVAVGDRFAALMVELTSYFRHISLVDWLALFGEVKARRERRSFYSEYIPAAWIGDFDHHVKEAWRTLQNLCIGGALSNLQTPM